MPFQGVMMLRRQTRAQKPIRKDNSELREKCFRFRGVNAGCHNNCAKCDFRKNHLEAV